MSQKSENTNAKSGPKIGSSRPAPKSGSDFPEFELADRVAERSKDEAPQETGEEVGGRKGPEPTRYGDWEKGGIASDF